MSMDRASLVSDLKHTLGASADKFDQPGDGDFIRLLDLAALDFGRKRPRTLVGALTPIAGQNSYPAPADILRPKNATWGHDFMLTRKPWDADAPKRFPILSVTEEAGARVMWIEPAPSAVEISRYGAEYRYFYFAGHKIDDDASKTTLIEGERQLLLLRAMAQAMQELAASGVTKPVHLKAGMVSVPKSSTPADYYRVLMEQFESA